MFKEYNKYVTIIKDRERDIDERQTALNNLILLYTSHSKQDKTEAFYYIKQSVLHLFKLGVLRGITERLRSLKMVWMQIMDSVTDLEMVKMGLSDHDMYDFNRLLKKFKYECDVHPYGEIYQMHIRDTGKEIYDIR